LASLREIRRLLADASWDLHPSDIGWGIDYATPVRSLFFASALFPLALVIAPACGGGEGGGGSSTTSTSSGGGHTGGTGGAAPGSLEGDYCRPLAELLCGRAVSCGCGVMLPGGQLDGAACTDAYTAKCVAAYAPLAAVVAAGQASISASEAHACVAMLEGTAAPCEGLRGAVAQALCPVWFSSAAALGDACDMPFCAGGAGACVSGSCVARTAEGGSCASTPCAEGLLCDSGTCRAPAPDGAACQDDAFCAPPLHCVGGSCHALAKAGEACAADAACALGLVCAGSICAARPSTPCSDQDLCGNLTTCGAPRRCVARGLAGAPCDGDDRCAEGFACDTAAGACALAPGSGEACANGSRCAAGLACDVTASTCGPIPASGQPCAIGVLGPFVCAAGLGCNAGTCGPMPGAGEACTVDNLCAAGLGCDFTATGSICGPLKDTGGSCQTDRTCKPGLYCDLGAGSCAPVRAAGSPCKDGNECGAAGACMPDASSALRCAPMPAEGGACSFDCAAGLVCASDLALASCLPEVCKAL
jgi:hypothetical protein